ncbi:DUF1223 domain-containing protein [Erythrobacter sp. BLCC-B19]|uniref:DUF1223 domain-containing protein n=1 Tax=Erythrobacter sp. BLCC-B19 TaxID=3025315 RepID=UPI0023621E10|nr:DUF1223 domain-containing protein [Erythrobacter sp. BLCC-B19]WDA42250.1 DUF1223 domain-containing protein [Erythrobacter sp. BLCC-B19]
MTFNRSVIALFGTLVVLGAATLGVSHDAPAAPATRNPVAVTGEPVLLELFTSQGCSSCPPADRLAETLATDPNLVVIARPVTYWDRLGWKDTLAREDNTALQQNYARRGLAGRNGVYTPQLVVNGQFGAVGSNARSIADGVARFGQAGGAAIRVARDRTGYAIDLSGSTPGKAELVLLAVTRRVTVGIGSGENGGRRIGYTNVLRAETKIGEWAGGQARLALDAGQLKVPGADRYALVLRQPGGGTVLAARWVA